MNEICFQTVAKRACEALLSLALLFILTQAARAQDAPVLIESSPTPASTPETDPIQRRIARARSLAAVGKLAAAASDLEALRSTTTDDSVRDVSRIMLMSIYVEMPDYTRAGTLLDETFDARAKEPRADSVRSYYALAGQVLNSVRTHLERYRTFGLNIADGDLPAEASSDLNQLRLMLERVVTHAKTLSDEVSKANSTTKDSDPTAALLEDAASVRLRLARTDEDRAHWQTEISDARQRLFTSDTRIASIRDVQFNRQTSKPAKQVIAAPATTTNIAPEQRNAPTPKPAPPAKERNKESAAASPNNVSSTTAATSQPPAPAPPKQTTGAPAAAEAKNPEARMISVGPLVGKAKQRVSPSYPSFAKMSRVTGVVTVYLIVNEKGDVETVQRTDGPAQLQSAAADAARRWKFTPTTIDGQNVRVSGFLSFNFAL